VRARRDATPPFKTTLCLLWPSFPLLTPGAARGVGTRTAAASACIEHFSACACRAGAMEATYCTLLVSQDKVTLPSQAEVQADLESADIPRKVNAVKTCILMILNGEDMSKLLMTVIRFCITVEDHEIKKLLMYFWEVVKKYDAAGHLKPEMILVWCVHLSSRRGGVRLHRRSRGGVGRLPL
jgi:hypothetical protein